MARYIFGRLVAAIPVLLVVALFVFSLLYVIPGDPAQIIAGETVSEADVEAIREKLGLNRPFWIRFGEWLWAICRGDFGMSLFSHVPVSTLILQRLEPTLSLSVLALAVTVLLAIPSGIVAALHVGRLPDRIAMGVAVLGFSVPAFVLGYVLILVFSVQLGWLPVQGFRSISEGVWPFLRHLILPSLALGLVLTALIMRITRTTMLEVLGQDFVRTARSKGLSTREIVFRHALPNAAIPIVTVIGLAIGALITGVVVTETVFALPGLGRLVVDAIVRRDYPVIQGVILVFAFAYVLVNLLIDISYPWFDPRIKY